MRPYQIKRIGNRTVEIISYPFGNKVNVRLVPMEPTTLKEVSVSQIQAHPILSKCERPRFVHLARVTGTGFFPINLLKFEGAWFFDDEKAGLLNPMEARFRHPTEIIIFKLCCDRKPMWHTDRWSSMDWKLEELSSKLLGIV